MRSNYKVQKTPFFRMLSHEQLEEIHCAALRILEEIGINIFHAEGIKLLQEAGAYVQEGR